MRIITDLSNSFHGQIILKEILFLTPKAGAKYLLIGSKNCLDGYIFSL